MSLLTQGVIRVASIEKIRDQVKNAHPRTRKAHLNTILGLLIKGGGMAVSLALLPITIDYLSSETYGTWLTISSIVSMLTFFDIGIGSGLRNKFSEAIAMENTELARSYLSTAYVAFGIIQICIIAVVVILFKYIPIQKILNTSIDNDQLYTVILITTIAIMLKLFFDVITYVLLAIQQPSISGLLTLASNITILIGTYFLQQYTHENLIYLACLTALTPVVVLIIASGFLYTGKLKMYAPKISLFNSKQVKSLLSLGYKFFVIQIAVVIVFYTDNIIITQLFGPSSVTTYNVAFRYFNAVNTLFAIIITPYWSAFTEAYIKRDRVWMSQTYQYLKKIWLGLTIIVIVMVIISEKVYQIWLGDRVDVPLTLSISMGFFVVISGWNNICVAVANGVGKIRLQLFYSIASALINVPLAIYFGRTLGLGSAGIILGTSVSLLIGSVLSGIQAKKIVGKRESKGIWNQ